MTQGQHPIITSTEVPIMERRILIVEDGERTVDV